MMSGKARLYLVVIAAVPEDGGERTRFLHLEAIQLPPPQPLRRLPFSTRWTPILPT